jgi:ABC-type Fe3+ transport system substrate-binding protein
MFFIEAGIIPAVSRPGQAKKNDRADNRRSLETAMDLAFTPEEQKFREEVRAWVRDNLPQDIAHKVHNALHLTREDHQRWARILGTRGWLGYGWPKQFGGPGWTGVQKHLFEEECALAGAPRVIPFGPVMVAPVIMAFGSPEGKRPQNFKDFWDVQRFPGRRGLRTRISETLEMALVADGVAPDKLYPLDVERGFKALDRIKPAVKKWIETTPETITLLTSNEIDYSYTYMSRVFPAQKAGLSVAMATGQTINSLEYLAVPKYSKNKDAAMRYVAFCLRPDRQAVFANTVFFAPNARKAVPLVAAESRQYMPDVLNRSNIIMNDAWWADKYDTLQKRFTEWMLT